MNPFIHFARAPWRGDCPITRPLLMQDSTTQKNMDIHPCLKQDSNPPS